MGRIRVVIIDDSIMFRSFLQKSLEGIADIELVGMFANPLEAIDQLPKLRPDVLSVDMEMPHMRGNELIRAVLPANPRLRAIVVSSVSDNVFDAMDAGAVDFIGKPGSQPGYTNLSFARDYVETIRAAAAANVHRIAPAARRPAPPPEPIGARMSLHRVNSKSLIAIGASTGGTEAILEVVKHFPANAPGVVVVQHMPPGFTEMYAQRVDRACAMKVREAKNKDRVEQGTILIAPGGDAQMRVEWDGSGYAVRMSPEPKVNGHCPSVDVLFESVARVAGSNAVGVILTGMGADGAKGLMSMRQKGAHTIGQDENTCIVYGMPKVAYDIGGVAEQLPLGSISSAVMRRFI